HTILQYLQLTAPDPRQDVAETVVVADLRMLVVRGRVPRLRREFARVADQRLVGRDKHSPTGGGDDLVAVERVDAHSTEGARGAAVVGGPERLRGVLDECHAMAVAGVEDRVDIRALAVEVNQDHRLRERPGACPTVELVCKQGGIEVPRV